MKNDYFSHKKWQLYSLKKETDSSSIFFFCLNIYFPILKKKNFYHNYIIIGWINTDFNFFRKIKEIITKQILTLCIVQDHKNKTVL